MKLFFIFIITCCIQVFASSNIKEPIRITGSASVYPAVSYILENSNPEVKAKFNKNPIIESVGTGAGFDSFCKQPFGYNSPDIVNASREISQKELENCRKNDISNLHKITIGLDGIVLAYFNKDKTFDGVDFSISDIQKALSKYTISEDKVIENNITHWNQIREDLPKAKILIYGPNSNSGTFDFLKDVIQKHCVSIPEMKATFGESVKNECGIIRQSVYIQMPDQDSTIARKVELQKGSIAILRFAFFQNNGKFKSIAIEKTEPTEEAIISGEYKISRPLFIYFDSTYVPKVRGMKEFLTQIAKFSYRDLIKEENEYNNPESSGIIVQRKGNTKECLENKKVINFEFNCGKNG